MPVELALKLPPDHDPAGLQLGQALQGLQAEVFPAEQLDPAPAHPAG